MNDSACFELKVDGESQKKFNQGDGRGVTHNQDLDECILQAPGLEMKHNPNMNPNIKSSKREMETTSWYNQG